MTKTPNAWIAVDHGIHDTPRLAPHILVLKGERSLYQAMVEDDWVLVLDTSGAVARVGRVLRVRSNLDTTTLYFDRVLAVGEPTSLAVTSFTPPPSGSIGRIQWADFIDALSKVLGTTIAEVPTVGSDARSPHYQQELAYIRELLQLAVAECVNALRQLRVCI